VTRRSPRTGESNHEGPRPAGKGLDLGGPGAYHGTTMLVHFRETPYGLAMSLVETHRENGKVRHETISRLKGILSKHDAVMKCQFDAFADYVSEAEAIRAWEGTECNSIN
jgi:hypothetical protein